MAIKIEHDKTYRNYELWNAPARSQITMTKYRKRFHLLGTILGLTLLTSCQPKNTVVSAEPTYSVTDSIKLSDLIEWIDLGDTLKIVTTDDIGYFPFGKFPLSPEVSPYFESYAFARTGAVQFYRVKGRNKIDFYLDPDMKVHQITKGEINEPDLKFVNNFHVGTSVKDILKYFRIKRTKNDSQYAVVMVETGLNGMTHFYDLHDSKIQRITFKTDYVFEDDANWPFKRD